MRDWRRTSRIVLTTAAITSVLWLAVGAVVLLNYRLVPPDSPLLVETSRIELGRIELGRIELGRIESGRIEAGPGRLVIPVEGVRAAQLSDTFNQARDAGLRVHDAIDILAPRGTPVLAAAPGRIEKLFTSKAGGITIYQRSPDGGLILYYAHLDAYAPGLAEGQSVRAGQRIASVGSTGNADPTAPHLHFAVLRTRAGARWSDRALPLNPYPLLGGR